MRIIAGQWRGRALTAPEGMATRPTADRVRETMFSMLMSRLGSFEDLRVADLYAGSGAIGLEALSRGAAFACFVDQDPRAVAAIRTNVDTLGAAEQCRVLARSVGALPLESPFDLLLADPPYEAGSGARALAHILQSGWAAPGSWIVIETQRGDPVDPGSCTIETERDVGRARLTFLRPATSSRRP